jgi:hypothetical protein
VTTPTDHFPRDTAGVPASRPTETIDVPDGGRVELRVAPVTKRSGDATVRMLAYNGSIPGPTLRVRQDSEIEVDVVNEGDVDATVHWHGLRLDNRFDGTHETQAPIPVGRSFTSRVTFPDPAASTGTTRTSARTTGRSSASTATSSSKRRTPTTGGRRTASSC